MRYAHGWIDGDTLEFSTVSQVPNTPNGRFWDIDLLVSFCREAAQFAAAHGGSIGIDSWGVDHGFIGKDGRLTFGPVMYRDPSHTQKFEELAGLRHRLFELTGIAHQPFNTFYQLAARLAEDPDLLASSEWLVMPGVVFTSSR